MPGPAETHPASTWIVAGCGVWLIAPGLYFAVLRPPLLPEDPRFMGTKLAQIRADLPGLENWLKRAFTVMGGFMAGAGVLTVFIATTAMRSATNFALHSDFRGVLVLPALVCLAGLAVYVAKG